MTLTREEAVALRRLLDKICDADPGRHRPITDVLRVAERGRTQMRREEKEMAGNKEKKVARICIEAYERMETTAEAWVFVGTDNTNKIDTSWVYVNEEEEEGIPKIIYLMAALAVAGQKMADTILKTGAINGDELQKIVEKAMNLIKKKEGEAEKC